MSGMPHEPLMVLEPDSPTPADFIRVPARTNPPGADAASIEATERRFDIVLPDLVRAIYALADGGETDFVFSPREAGAPLDPPAKSFDDVWRDAVPDERLLPLTEWETLTEIQAGYDHDPDGSWADYLPGADRMVRFARHGWDIYLCLDYSAGRTDPAVVLFDDARWNPSDPEPFEARWPDFADFFGSLRRLTMVEHDGGWWRGVVNVGSPPLTDRNGA